MTRGTTPWSELRDRPYRRWYQFGWRSPEILYKRFKNKHMWWFRLRMAWQRARHEFSEDQFWGLDHTVARLVVAGIKSQRAAAHGYPGELGSWEEWDEILAKIQISFQVFLDHSGWWDESSEYEKIFQGGMALFAKWFGGLWD